ncbi:MAG: hypothetical protein LUI05_00695, partial [Oscillospiraceae bacterium]|nr:hypothetical protein [Oscillospiraceae bacterium]
MNMKKTIAAVAAGAVALSAMATTVSAESGSLHYNLTANMYDAYSGSVTFSTTVSGFDVAEAVDNGAEGFQIRIKGDSSKLDFSSVVWTVNGYVMEAGTSANVKTDSFSYVSYNNISAWYDNYVPEYVQNDNGNAYFTIPFAAGGVTVTSGTLYATVSVTIPTNDTGWASAASYYGVESEVYAVATAPNASWTDYDGDGEYIQYEVMSPTTAGQVVYPTGAEYDNSGAITDGSVTYPVITYGDNNATVGIDATDTDSSKTIDSSDSTYYSSNKLVVAGSNYVHPTTSQYPMMTSTNTASVSESDLTVYFASQASTYGDNKNFLGSYGNILEYLENSEYSLVSDGVSYANVKAVINDVIANYDDVTFVFNTAASGIAYDENTYYAKILNKTVTVPTGYKYDSDGDTQYTSFSQQLYNLYGDETTGY